MLEQIMGGEGVDHSNGVGLTYQTDYADYCKSKRTDQSKFDYSRSLIQSRLSSNVQYGVKSLKGRNFLVHRASLLISQLSTVI